MTKSSIEIKTENDNVFINIQNLGIASKKERKSWTIFCPSLKVLGYSNKSEKKALEDFEENLSFFFTVHLEDNTLDRALLGFKWNKKELSLTQTLRAVKEHKKVFPKIEFINKDTLTPALNTRNFKVPVRAYA